MPFHNEPARPDVVDAAAAAAARLAVVAIVSLAGRNNERECAMPMPIQLCAVHFKRSLRPKTPDAHQQQLRAVGFWAG